MTNEKLNRIEGRLETLEGDVHRIEGCLENLESNFQRIEGRMENLEGNFQRIEQKLADVIVQIREITISIDTYQKSYQQVVNLAFGLIVAATATIVIPAVVGK
jgi:chromosome segregation ATPase